MGNFDQKVNKFLEIFLEEGGYVKVIEGLQNTLLIAVAGLIIGILIGTVIATVRVLPKSKDPERNLQLLRGSVQGNADCSPAACVLLCAASHHWVEDYRGTGLYAGVRSEQRSIHIRDYEKRNPVCGSGADGGGPCGGIKFWRQYD